MYFPIPDGVYKTQTVKASHPKMTCSQGATVQATATISVPKSTVSRTQKSNSAFFEVNRSTDGQWSKVKDSGSIKMTPMSIKNEKVTYNLGQVIVPLMSFKTCRTGNPYAYVNNVCIACADILAYDVKAAIVRGSYVEQGDLDYWKLKYPNAPHYVLHEDHFDDSKIEAAKSSAYAELFQAYNLGEEIAELRESISGITKLMSEAVGILLRFRKALTSLAKKDSVQEAGSRWMEFRYGIMPIMYSVQDIIKLQQESGVYRTVRKRVDPEFGLLESPSESTYFQDVGVNELRCNITAKARWSTPELKQFDLININPLTTATAVIPWAMVARWFFNVQSYLDSKVKSLTSLALESHACVAIREKREYGTYLVCNTGYQNISVIDSGDSGCGAGYYGQTDFGTFSDIRANNVLLKWVSINNYTRYLYQPSDVKLVFSPHITWQRTIDAMVLMMGPMSKLLRRLK